MELFEECAQSEGGRLMTSNTLIKKYRVGKSPEPPEYRSKGYVYEFQILLSI